MLSLMDVMELFCNVVMTWDCAMSDSFDNMDSVMSFEWEASPSTERMEDQSSAIQWYVIEDH